MLLGKAGKVTGLEGNEYMAYIMENGLKTWSSSVSEIDEAMQRIQVKQTEHFSF